MCELQIRIAGRADVVTAHAQAGERLADVLRREGVDFALPCGGRGHCGRCRLAVRGACMPPRAEELALLAAGGSGFAPTEPEEPAMPEGYVLRLACFCRVAGDGEILLPQAAAAQSAAAGPVVATGYDGGDGPGALGAAVDIGTTTITLALHQLHTGVHLCTEHENNRQQAFGADVLSRIAHANAHGHAELHRLLCGQVQQMLARAMVRSGSAEEQLCRLVVTGNTTMLHFFAGLDPAGIGVAPFRPESLFGEVLQGWQQYPGAEVYLPPAISAYVGADVTCGVLAAGFAADAGNRLLVDVGTNGEMLLAANGRLLCCATAAGPAFEGAEISMGMAATPGAITRLWQQPGGQLCWDTVGGAPAVGICGTGLISAVNWMCGAGVLEENGRIEEAGHPYTALIHRQAGQPVFAIGDSGVALTQQDIRSIQLAKAAIAAGVETLLHAADLPHTALKQLALAGGFGSYIDVKAAAGIGLIPPELATKAYGAGNLALQGATSLLFNRDLRDQAAQIARDAQEVQLATDPFFMEQYIDCMPFFEE